MAKERMSSPNKLLNPRESRLIELIAELHRDQIFLKLKPASRAGEFSLSTRVAAVQDLADFILDVLQFIGQSLGRPVTIPSK